MKMSLYSGVQYNVLFEECSPRSGVTILQKVYTYKILETNTETSFKHYKIRIFVLLQQLLQNM